MVDEPELVKFARSCGEAYAFCGDEIVKIWKLGLAAGRAEARQQLIKFARQALAETEAP